MMDLNNASLYEQSNHNLSLLLGANTTINGNGKVTIHDKSSY
jgi:hypothetical protein